MLAPAPPAKRLRDGTDGPPPHQPPPSTSPESVCTPAEFKGGGRSSPVALAGSHSLPPGRIKALGCINSSMSSQTSKTFFPLYLKGLSAEGRSVYSAVAAGGFSHLHEAASGRAFTPHARLHSRRGGARSQAHLRSALVQIFMCHRLLSGLPTLPRPPCPECW